jgi:hypothetical protein
VERLGIGSPTSAGEDAALGELAAAGSEVELPMDDEAAEGDEAGDGEEALLAGDALLAGAAAPVLPLPLLPPPPHPARMNADTPDARIICVSFRILMCEVARLYR